MRKECQDLDEWFLEMIKKIFRMDEKFSEKQINRKSKKVMNFYRKAVNAINQNFGYILLLIYSLIVLSIMCI